MHNPPYLLFFIYFILRVTAQRETGEWESQEKTWLAFTLPKILLAGTMGCQAVKRYALNYVKTLSDNLVLFCFVLFLLSMSLSSDLSFCLLSFQSSLALT